MLARFSNILLVSALAVTLAGGCSGPTRPDPRDTVKELFAAINKSDSLYLTTNIDLERAAASIPDDLTIDPAAGGASSLLGALTGEGHLRKRWLGDQIVVGDSQEAADTAFVEVSFIDRVTRVQYYNKMRLEYRVDHWAITSFKTL
jgi:hypothetical protein